MTILLAAALAAAQTSAGNSAAPAGIGTGSTAPAISTRGPCCVLARLTPVLLTIEEQIDSDKVVIGQTFRIRLADPLVLAGGLTIPAGTIGQGEVVHAAKSRAMGKAGELLLAARYLDFLGTRIPLRSFQFGKPQGLDNMGTAAIVGIAVSALAAPFITGGEVRIPPGSEAWAKVAADVAFSPPVQTQLPLPSASGSASSVINTEGGK